MRFARESPRVEWALAIGMVGILFALLLEPTGCTVRPDISQSQTIAFDGSDQTAGFLGWTNGSGIITERARARYNGLVLRYGTNFVPPLVLDDGLARSNEVWLISREALVNFQTMSRWKRSGK